MIYGLSDVVTISQMIAQGESGDERKRVERQKLESLLAYAETTRCRRELLLGAFGEAYAGPCGHCDNCLSPPPTWDATVPAQKALSAVYRSGQRFGAGHVIDILRGVPGGRMSQLGHDRLGVFGAGAELDNRRWRSVFRQLLALGLLEADGDGFGTLRLTAASRGVLSGMRQVQLREDLGAPRGSRRRQGGRAASAAGNLGIAAHEQPLWEALRTLRLSLAKAQGVPPYVVFHDKTLREMVAVAPRTLSELGNVAGVGAVKLERYGEKFLAALSAPRDAVGEDAGS